MCLLVTVNGVEIDTRGELADALGTPMSEDKRGRCLCNVDILRIAAEAGAICRKASDPFIDYEITTQEGLR